MTTETTRWRQRLAGSLSNAAYAAGWAGLKAVPAPVAERAFDLGADVGWRRDGKGVRRLRANLARVLGPGADDAELDALTRAAVRSYARYWLEVFRLPTLHREQLRANFQIADGKSVAGFPQDRGIVLALAHMGNWDVAGAYLVDQGVRFTTVAERLEPVDLFDRFVAFRESLGMEVLPLSGGQRPPFDVLADRLTDGQTICLLADRDLTATGVDVDLFGATARMPAGPAALALRTGAALIPTTLWFTDHGWGCRLHDEIPPTSVATMTQAMADAFAGAIREHPADWHMLSRLWLDDLDPRP